MRKPPIPAEENPLNHHELPGQPPANHLEDPAVRATFGLGDGSEREEMAEQDTQDYYEEEDQVRGDDLLHQRKDPLNNPKNP